MYWTCYRQITKLLLKIKRKKYCKTEKLPLTVKNKSEKLISNGVFVSAYLGKVWQCSVQFMTTGHGGQVLN